MKSALKRVVLVLLLLSVTVVAAYTGPTDSALAAGSSADLWRTASGSSAVRGEESVHGSGVGYVTTAGKAVKSAVRGYVGYGIPLLSSFGLGFYPASKDHHISIINVTPSIVKGNITVGLQDDDGKETFGYQVMHQVVHERGVGIEIASDICRGGRCSMRIRNPGLTTHQFVLVGFAFWFCEEGSFDHHLHEIGVLEQDGLLTVMYNDKNDDDRFRWTVRYAYIPNSRITAMGAKTNYSVRSAVGPDSAHRIDSSGPNVIRGFRVAYSRDDHHIQHISAQTSRDWVAMFLNDKDGTDLIDWELRWASLYQG